jgi:hypothetical protein
MVKDSNRTLRYSQPQEEIDPIIPDLLGQCILSYTEKGKNSITLKISACTAALLSVALRNAIALTDNNEIDVSIKQIRTRKKKIRGKEKTVYVGRWTVNPNINESD